MDSDKLKTRQANKKQNLVCIQTSPRKTVPRLSDERSQSNKTLPKRKSRLNEDFPFNKTHNSKSLVESSLTGIVKCEKTRKNMSGKRLLSNFSSKQFNIKVSKVLQKKQQKYIFNVLGNVNQRNNLAIKSRNSSLSSHNKSHSNQTLIRKTCDPKDNSAFSKTSNMDFTKIKKKKHDYVKRFNKTACLEKSVLTGSHSVGHYLSQTLGNMNSDKYNQNLSKFNLNTPKMGIQQPNNIKYEHQKQMTQIQCNIDSLFKKLKSPNKEKLKLITNGYERIVSELYGALAKQNTLPELDLIRINTYKQNHLLKINASIDKQTNKNYANPIKNDLFENSHPFDFSQRDQTDSQHWDSYLDYGQNENTRGSTIVKPASLKLSAVKKLDLGNLKKQAIKQYHEEFMDNLDFFSDSWKRQLDHQKKF